VELYARVRRAVVVDKMSEREAAKEFGLARETVRKMLRYAVPPGYRRQQPVRRPKLDAWVGTIDQILEDDKTRGKKQRHTAKRIFERLRDEHSYTGGYTIVKDYVRLRKLSQRDEVARAIDDALRLGAISFDAVKHLLLCRIEQRPARLDLENYPHLPAAQVATTAASDYLALLEAC